MELPECLPLAPFKSAPSTAKLNSVLCAPVPRESVPPARQGSSSQMELVTTLLSVMLMSSGMALHVCARMVPVVTHVQSARLPTV